MVRCYCQSQIQVYLKSQILLMHRMPNVLFSLLYCLIAVFSFPPRCFTHLSVCAFLSFIRGCLLICLFKSVCACSVTNGYWNNKNASYIGRKKRKEFQLRIKVSYSSKLRDTLTARNTEILYFPKI